jgi:hypothetical protein
MLVFRCWFEDADGTFDGVVCIYAVGEDLAELDFKVKKVERRGN